MVDLAKPRIFVDPDEECVESAVSFRCCTQNSVLTARATCAVGPDRLAGLYSLPSPPRTYA